MYYHIYNNLDKLINGDLAKKFGQGTPPLDKMNRKCNCYIPSKVNIKLVYEGICRRKILNYELERSLCDSIYISITQQIFK